MQVRFTPALPCAAAVMLASVAAGSSARATTLTTIYSFCSQASCADGKGPTALVTVGGVLYGTTATGGFSGRGTVFSVTPQGIETVLHSFGMHIGDGLIPDAGLIHVGRTLYGTTTGGGAHNPGCYTKVFQGCGTVFSKALNGHETVVYSFGGSAAGDGLYPSGSLLYSGGTLYGTTSLGGASSNCRHGCGTVFSVTPHGVERLLHSFDLLDGYQPIAGLTNASGTLYGTTALGGPASCGTVFSITLQGVEALLHNFGVSGKDGCSPASSLVNVDGKFYGTTYSGPVDKGATSYGTVFSTTPQGHERVLYSLGMTAGDGRYPEAGVINVGGILYGTTSIGGVSGYGTVFSITPKGVETVLYSFGVNPGDGRNPAAGLVNVGGTLYGTTSGGGVNGGGTVFSIVP